MLEVQRTLLEMRSRGCVASSSRLPFFSLSSTPTPGFQSRGISAEYLNWPASCLIFPFLNVLNPVCGSNSVGTLRTSPLATVSGRYLIRVGLVYKSFTTGPPCLFTSPFSPYITFLVSASLAGSSYSEIPSTIQISIIVSGSCATRMPTIVPRRPA